MGVVIRRSLCLERLLGLVDAPMVKVLRGMRGMRRCGKSFLLRQVRDELVARGDWDWVIHSREGAARTSPGCALTLSG
jgi:hypothetical protein